MTWAGMVHRIAATADIADQAFTHPPLSFLLLFFCPGPCSTARQGRPAALARGVVGALWRRQRRQWRGQQASAAASLATTARALASADASAAAPPAGAASALATAGAVAVVPLAGGLSAQCRHSKMHVRPAPGPHKQTRPCHAEAEAVCRTAAQPIRLYHTLLTSFSRLQQ